MADKLLSLAEVQERIALLELRLAGTMERFDPELEALRTAKAVLKGLHHLIGRGFVHHFNESCPSCQEARRLVGEQK